MKKLIRSTALFMILLILCSNLTMVHAKSECITIQVSGQANNPHFADTSFLGGTVEAPVYYGTAQTPQYSADAAALSATIRDGLEQRKAEITVHYSVNYAFPNDDQAANDAAYAIAEDLFEDALAETDQPTQGDSLRYCYRRWSLDGNLTLWPDRTDLTLTYVPTYFTTKSQEDALTTAVDALIEDFAFTSSTSQKEKMDTIYDYITENIVYDYENLEDDSYLLKFSAYAALIHKTAVCEGYAVLFYRLAEECGLDARVITGIGGEGEQSNHAWNIVQLGETYYYLDSTWDAGKTEYAYYLKGDDDFEGHQNDAFFDSTEFRSAYPIATTGYKYEGTEYTEGNFKYTISGGIATVTKYIGEQTHVVVPATIGGFPVHHIGYQAFYGCNARSITISEGIRSLSVQALDYCNQMTSLHLPSTMNITCPLNSGLTTAPSNCFSLETITIAPGNPYIKLVDGVLYSADMTTLLLCPAGDGKTKLTDPTGVTTIAKRALADHKTLTEVVLPNTVTTIGYFAFCASNQLEKVNIPATCEKIYQYSFSFTSIQELHLPAALTFIHSCAFYECDPQTITVDPQNPVFRVTNGMLHDTQTVYRIEVDTTGAVTVPEGITDIDNGAFMRATGITAITLPSTLDAVGNGAFSGCDELTHITIPEGTTHINNLAFGSCKKLVSVILPESLTDYGEFLFHPYNHTTIYGGTKAQQVAWSFGLTYKPLSQFSCSAGHTLEKEYTNDDPFRDDYRYVCSVCDGYTQEYVVFIPNIMDAEVTLEFTTATYTGQPITPKVLSVVYKGERLTENVDYTVTYPTTTNIEVGTSGIGIWGKGKYAGYKSASFSITHASIADATIVMPQTNFVYEGQPIQPEFTVTWNGKTLERYEDYGFTFENNNKEGIATLVVTGNRNFNGEIRKDFAIGEHDHRYEDTSLNDQQHQGICVCGRTTTPQNHTYDNDCDYYCNDCYFYREVTHPWSDVWSYDGWRHFRRCTRCDEVGHLGEHTGGTATCGAQAVCTVCHNPYGAQPPHSWNTDVLYHDEYQHWYQCHNCPATDGHTDHSGGTASCAQQAICSTCRQPYGDFLTHSFTGAVTNITALGHQRQCAHCSAVGPMLEHTYNGSLCTICGYTPPVVTPTNPFADVKTSDYFSAPVLWAVQKGVTSGTSPTTFSPFAFCTRGQVVTFLWRAAGSPQPHNMHNPFVDVKSDQYYYKAVLWAVEKGITAGMDASHFAPNAVCTRAQVVTFLYRYAGSPVVTAHNPFVDVKSHEFYYKPVLWAVKNGITSGMDATHFAPGSTCTRAQGVTFLYRHSL